MDPDPERDLLLQTPRGRVAARAWGEDGTPVLGLHGWLDNAATFDRLAPLVPGIRLVAIDFPGHGRSDHRPPGMRYHYTDYVDDVLAAADALGWERFAVLGHSMGAGIACLTAAGFPDRVTRVALIEGLGAVTVPPQPPAEALRRAILGLQAQNIETRRPSKPFGALVEARSAAGALSRESAEILLRRAVRLEPDGLAWRSDPRLGLPTPVLITDALMLDYLTAIEAPVLLILAEDGTLIRRPYLEPRCRAIRHLDIVKLMGGHHLHLDRAEAVAGPVAAFLTAPGGPAGNE